MPRQLWDSGLPTSVEGLNLAMRQQCRRYRTTTEADADNPSPMKGQVRIVTGIDLPTRERPVTAFRLQYFNGTAWADALLT